MNKRIGLTAILSLAILGPFFLKGIHLKNPPRIEKKEFSRIYKDVELSLQRAVESDYLITEIKIIGDRIFLNDFHSRQIVEVDHAGNTLQRFGKQGKGPGEFMRIDGLDIDDSGIYVCDSKNLRITEMAIDGSRQSTVKLNKAFVAGNRLSRGTFFFFSPDWSSRRKHVLSVFDMADSSSTVITSDFLNQYPAIGLGSFSIKGEQGFCVLAGYNTGYIMGIDGNATVRYAKSTIDNTQPPKAIYANGLQILDPKAPQTIYHGYADMKSLYLISGVLTDKDREEKNLPIDVYDLMTGNYLHSFYVPVFKNEPAMVFAIDIKKKQVLAYQGQTLTFYRIVRGL